MKTRGAICVKGRKNGLMFIKNAQKISPLSMELKTAGCYHLFISRMPGIVVVTFSSKSNKVETHPTWQKSLPHMQPADIQT